MDLISFQVMLLVKFWNDFCQMFLQSTAGGKEVEFNKK